MKTFGVSRCYSMRILNYFILHATWQRGKKTFEQLMYISQRRVKIVRRAGITEAILNWKIHFLCNVNKSLDIHLSRGEVTENDPIMNAVNTDDEPKIELPLIYSSSDIIQDKVWWFSPNYVCLLGNKTNITAQCLYSDLIVANFQEFLLSFECVFLPDNRIYLPEPLIMVIIWIMKIQIIRQK